MLFAKQEPKGVSVSSTMSGHTSLETVSARQQFSTGQKGSATVLPHSDRSSVFGGNRGTVIDDKSPNT